VVDKDRLELDLSKEFYGLVRSDKWGGTTYWWISSTYATLIRHSTTFLGEVGESPSIFGLGPGTQYYSILDHGEGGIGIQLLREMGVLRKDAPDGITEVVVFEREQRLETGWRFKCVVTDTTRAMCGQV
jgi:hypothetical protein